MTNVTWVTAFIDLPRARHAAGTAFWAAVTGYAVSPGRGDVAEFTTLVPPQGDPFLKLQRTEGPAAEAASLHLDLHVQSSDAAAARAESLGARVLHRSPHGYVVLASPGGFVFCFVHEPLEERPGATRWPHGHESLVDQVCLDVPPDRYDAECDFWEGLTRWDLRRASRPEFRHLVRPEGIPVRILLQRLDAPEALDLEAGASDATDGMDEPDGPAGPPGEPVVRGHLDLATDDRAAEVARHESLGARRLPDVPGSRWTVLRDPAGMTYCVTDRDPGTGLLA